MQCRFKHPAAPTQGPSRVGEGCVTQYDTMGGSDAMKGGKQALTCNDKVNGVTQLRKMGEGA